ncbi:MAG: MotA/TolQ/ExbB proton channel family protein [Kiritimatiellae bacterium]|jgi:biopolymer transport protein ExbB|nr:MotA/TolQ/ExbB proton channel family protein [Kiritimatiellia bacterium]
MRFKFIILTILFCGSMAFGETNKVLSAISTSEKDIKAAVKELNEVQSRIQKDKEPIILSLKTEKSELLKLRKKAESARLASGTGFDRLQSLKEDVDRLKREMNFIDSELQEYRRSILTIAPVVEQESMIPLLDRIDENRANSLIANVEGDAKILFDVSYGWCNYTIGGYLKKGICLDLDGYEQSGTFAVMGNLAWFFGNNGDAGLVVQRINSVKPSYVSTFSKEETGQIKKLCTEGSGKVPMDLNKGDAIKIHDSKKTFLDDFKAGGYTIYPLIAIGIVSVIAALLKWIYLIHLKPFNKDLAEKLADAVSSGKDVESLLNKFQKPFRTIFREATDNADIPKEHLEEILYEQIVMATPNIRKYIGMLAVFGAVAPLLGLLGTVTGMIHTFEVITIFGTGNPAILSSGISEALITTKVGLAIAIPTLLVHAYLSAKAKTVISELEDQAIYFVNVLKK